MFSYWQRREDPLTRCIEDVVFNIGVEGDKCFLAAVEYLCKKRLGEATSIDKIAVKYGVSLLCVYKWYAKLYQEGVRYPRDRVEQLLEQVRGKYGVAIAEEVKNLYNFLKSKGALDGLKPEGVIAALLYYAAKKHGLRYDSIRTAEEFGVHPETVEKNIVIFQWYLHGKI
ncbi:conserved hypothetical protein [Pyrobaculum islandicum DSM 4184]|uniref:Uncharacterized protein n=1 Tax=Pyrobaculum islandicum (strain DSM 4184 / JCM 9189 / GEO3) TaxID=384616 RepID=A1RQP4_PYRIL|nr:hypothetical protein [Pyrobaculum islandicum]ABL87276.1 conserved hypothetical protein [Pyrobaculum islandicum DSM 4184]